MMCSDIFQNSQDVQNTHSLSLSGKVIARGGLVPFYGGSDVNPVNPVNPGEAETGTRVL